MSTGPAHVHIVRFAPAKLNITLAVTGRRADGFHSLHSIMFPLTLGDALTVRVAGSAATGDSLRVSGLPVSAESDNLVLKAIAGARDAVAQLRQGPEAPPALLAALLSKRIPVAAGLGGGSSDAAAAIDAALGAWGLSLPARDLSILAAALGSDVPFFQAGCGAVVTGRGENVEPLPPMTEPAAILLITPRLAVSTEAVFRAYAGGARPAGDAALQISEELAAELRRSPVPSVLLDRAADLALANDLVPATAATAPGLPGFTAALTSLLERPVCQSGSGPSLWSVYATLDEARRAMKKVRQAVTGGSLPAVGDGEPFIAATLIAAQPLAWRPAGPQTDASPPEPPDLPLAGRPRAVHNWPDAGKRGPHDPGRTPGSGGA